MNRILHVFRHFGTCYRWMTPTYTTIMLHISVVNNYRCINKTYVFLFMDPFHAKYYYVIIVFGMKIIDDVISNLFRLSNCPLAIGYKE